MSFPNTSNISLIYRHILKQVSLALPCHRELFDPDEIDENPPEILKSGYGLLIGDGENTNLCISAREYFHRRTFTVMITREAVAIQGDLETRAQKWLDIMEDLHKVMKRLAQETSIVDVTVTPARVLAFKSAYTSDSGPRNAIINGEAIIFLELTLTVEYRESTTGGN